MLKILTPQDHNQSQADIVDGKLILTLPTAITPAVWQMDLAGTKASVMEVQEKGEEFVLVLRTPSGENLDVASFAQRANAVEALMIISSALKEASGKIYVPGAPANDAISLSPVAPKKASSMGSIIFKIFGVLGMILVGYLLLITVIGLSSGARQNASVTSPQAEQSSGVPMSADDFLSGQ